MAVTRRQPEAAPGVPDDGTAAAPPEGEASEPLTAAAEADQHLLALLCLLEGRVRHAVAARRQVDDDPDDAFRGLYLDDEGIDRLLEGGWPPLPPLDPDLRAARLALDEAAGRRDGEGQPTRLSATARRFGLTPLDTDLLVVAVAPDLDSRFERFYGYLNDDVTRRRATIGLALELCGEQPTGALGRMRLSAGAPLVAGGLVLVEELDRPFLTRSLRVPDRVIAHLLGDARPAAELAALLVPVPPPVAIDPEPLSRALAAGSGFAYLRERGGSAGRALASQALAMLGRSSINLDCSRIDPDTDVNEIARAAGREARLTGAGIVAGPLEALGDTGNPRERSLVRAVAELPVPVVLLGRGGWDPTWSQRVPIVIEAPLPERSARLGFWSASLDAELPDASDLEAAVGTFRLAPDQVLRGAEAARLHAAYSGAGLGLEHLRAGARSQNAAGLERLARRIEPKVGFEDLVLPPLTVRLLRELVSRVRFRDRVLGDWAMRPGGGRGQGVTALFAGDSGTGKTMSAEVVAGALGLDLYTINLATVVDKYVGETEKNLERIFSEVDGVNGVLLFDEADALFGKRSEVRDAHDRYANIEVAYLLQRIETFDGLAILATNLRANVDEAFTRRLDTVVDFPFPEVAERRVLWERCLGTSVALGDDTDLDFLASSFELSGGNIRSIALTAGYLAAEREAAAGPMGVPGWPGPGRTADEAARAGRAAGDDRLTPRRGAATRRAAASNGGSGAAAVAVGAGSAAGAGSAGGAGSAAGTEPSGELAMADLIRAVHREYRKLGRLSVRSEFGSWYSVVADEAS
ncbi:MAG TPA: ATP-binding protein [Acidimicrobiales bacterium]|nr:ATP-binding protein [Acidimicrobiales bacterium]